MVRLLARLPISLASALALVCATGPLTAQIVYPGDTRVEMSDVTGPPLTSGDLFGPGTMRSFTCEVAWGVRTVADRTRSSLEGGGGPPVVAVQATERLLSEGMRRDLLLVTTDEEGDDAASRRLIDALSAGNAPDVHSSAKGLVERLNGLLSNARRLRPERPGYRTATQLASLVGAYNTFLDHSSAAFLSRPPEALIGIQAVLAPIVIAAIENEGRDASRRAGPGELACAPPVAPPPTLVVERPAVVCVIAPDGLRALGAIVLSSGDTMVVAGGRRIPLSEAYPQNVRYAADAAWYANAEPITVNGLEYVQFGLPRLAPADTDVRRVGEYRGVPLFAAPGEDNLVIPVRADCLLHDYRPVPTLRPRG